MFSTQFIISKEKKKKEIDLFTVGCSLMQEWVWIRHMAAGKRSEKGLKIYTNYMKGKQETFCKEKKTENEL